MILDLGKGKVEETLLDIGYYRLGFYWHPFELDKEHNFKEGTKFSDAVKLYYLDLDLRTLLQKYLNRVEINFRTKVVYTVSNHYKTNPIWFVDRNTMSKKFIDDFDKKIYTPIVKKKPAIKAHHEKHLNDRYAPAWKTLEYLTFGNLETLFNNLKDEKIKGKIASCFRIKELNVFINHIKVIVRLRNICAHGSLLYDDRLPTEIKRTPGLIIQGNDRKKLIASIKLLTFYVNKTPKNRSKDLTGQIGQVMQKHKDSPVLKNIIETKSGYKFD